ncbi:hypothetical protein E2C01_005832 [Portunus trituberculatus]|uniref:Uncharacterized protein n=1 Tax=Portunus trituberculatus TaxID=210409 RepID=A0A5B7CTP8_PORTR|nr:hypothetical protein [Portunus trituberculatus]
MEVQPLINTVTGPSRRLPPVSRCPRPLRGISCTYRVAQWECGELTPICVGLTGCFQERECGVSATGQPSWSAATGASSTAPRTAHAYTAARSSPLTCTKHCDTNISL